MSPVVALVRRAQALGIRLWLDDEGLLRADVPEDAPDEADAVVDELVARAGEVKACLRAQRVAGSPRPPGPAPLPTPLYDKWASAWLVDEREDVIVTPSSSEGPAGQDPGSLLLELCRRGIGAWRDGGNVRLRAPRGALDEALRAQLAAALPALLPLLPPWRVPFHAEGKQEGPTLDTFLPAEASGGEAPAT